MINIAVTQMGATGAHRRDACSWVLADVGPEPRFLDSRPRAGSTVPDEVSLLLTQPGSPRS